MKRLDNGKRSSVVCNWCGVTVGESIGEGITPGICDSCLLHNFPHLYQLIKNILGVNKMEDFYKKPMIAAGRLNGQIHKTKKVWRKGLLTYCGKVITKPDLLLMMQRPEDITCPECRELDSLVSKS